LPLGGGQQLETTANTPYAFEGATSRFV